MAIEDEGTAVTTSGGATSGATTSRATTSGATTSRAATSRATTAAASMGPGGDLPVLPAEARLREMVVDWQRVGDRRAIFAESYRRMTTRMHEAILADEFTDSAWVGRLLDVFADYYFVACDAHEGGGATCPGVWDAAFTACVDDHQHPLQVLFLGVNAHINHDLVFALADVLDDWEDLDEPARARRLDDHRAVNTVIARTVDEVQDEVVDKWSPIMDHVDRMLGPLDEWLFSRMIAGWRDDVWASTQLLLTSDRDDRPEVEAAIHAHALRIARMVLRL